MKDVFEKLKGVLTESDLQETKDAYTKAVNDGIETRLVEEKKTLELTLEEQYNKKLNESIETQKTALTEEYEDKYKTLEESTLETLDAFLSSEIESQIGPDLIKNVAINEMSFPIVEGIKELFEKHYVALDVEGAGLVKNLKEETDKLTSELSESMEKNIALNKENDKIKKNSLVESKTSSLTEGEKKRVIELFESKDFSYTEDKIDSFITLITESKKETPKKDSSGNLIVENIDPAAEVVINKPKVNVKPLNENKSMGVIAGELL